ncbi:MAG: signal peptide peptidase SppA [Candidatus Woesearchaeota archaeon]|jgi:protease-4|nr:signal peptide peptidase SppA [Candidatus Woesearchaeota archaeon]MDP7263484.1 signal peptide peptidase SppA [Candidatus Woesearchaeota archaeon]MDP7476494.1 signal peptide peptidase SppA [Candidatus Woesearchaeota archaeon]HJN57326.1 signal peptide peptidase SppA [Candidatus Woesearchaeota archaeon]|tara:strand:+ start:3370 stop:4305 length:936 start_codon:yes stop_codon:yes gene_type:complete
MKEKKGSRWAYALKVIIGLIILSFFISVFLSVFIGNGFENIDGNVAVIEITGIIIAEEDTGLLFDDVSSSDEITKLIRKADKNDRIKAIIFEINSPGGSAVASDEIALEIKKINKTTVAWIREIGTSGAYWIASSTDYVIANRMSITGSIGVISSYLGFSGFLEEHNITYERLVAGRLKDLGSPFKELTEEERALFEKSLDAIHEFFIEEVAENRGLSKNDVRKVATGAFILGIEAEKAGLVDELGSRDEVISYVEEQIGEEAELTSYKKQKGLLRSLSQAFNEQSFYIGKGFGSVFFDKAEQGDRVSIRT